MPTTIGDTAGCCCAVPSLFRSTMFQARSRAKRSCYRAIPDTQGSCSAAPSPIVLVQYVQSSTGTDDEEAESCHRSCRAVRFRIGPYPHGLMRINGSSSVIADSALNSWVTIDPPCTTRRIRVRQYRSALLVTAPHTSATQSGGPRALVFLDLFAHRGPVDSQNRRFRDVANKICGME